jgi:hypothetical protein
MLRAEPADGVAELLGQFDPASHPDFEQLPADWTDKEAIFLRRGVLSAFGSMRAAAQRDGIRLLVRSATRTFAYQRGIWEAKWARPQHLGWRDVEKARDIMRYSSMPGTSRHHWGTDIDLNKFEAEWFETGEGKRLHDWLGAHASEFGFWNVYDDKRTSGRGGYEWEPWHWSHLPTAGGLLAAYNERVTIADLAGFSGAEAAGSLDVLREFVNGVSLPAAVAENVKT